MQVRAAVEGLDKTTIPRELREDPQLNLRIVSDHELPPGGITTEATPVLNRVGHLLNVWVRASEAPRRRADLAKVSVQPASDGIDHVDHVRAVTRERFLHRAILEQGRDHRILSGQRLQLPVAR